MRRVVFALGAGLLLLVLAPRLFGFSPPFLLQLTASEPRGIYWLRPLPDPSTRGMLGTLHVPPSVAELVFKHGWLPRSWHGAETALLKPVAGLPGDTFCVDEHSVTVNGVWQGPVYRELSGVKLPVLRGCWLIQEDHALLISPQLINAFDSRYFGPVPRDMLLKAAQPLWKWD
jgi:type IV secretory pathway protease TraF